MNSQSKITADYSSIVGLKAELLRKRQEARELKSKNTTPSTSIHHKPKVKVSNSKEKSSKKKDESPKVTEIEDINQLKKSKLMLEAKTKLYNRLQKTGEKNDLFLVDFANKSDTEKSDPESEKSENEDNFKEVTYDSDENFIEYKDCFGRTRKCLREDLSKMQEKDDLLRQQMSKEPIPDKLEEKEIEEKQVQVEPEIEMMRKKWEEQANRLANKDNIYYQDVLFDEARTHGVGYYNFSIDEEERAKQQANLEKLRKDTEQKQKEMQDLKQMRQKMEKNRLKVARIRQRVRAGLPAELSDEEDVPDDAQKQEESENTKKEESDKQVDEKVDKQVYKKVDKQIDKKIELSKEENENSLAVIQDKVKAFGELLGKKMPWREMSQEEWVAKRRDDRLSEFSPMYEGFKSAGYMVSDVSVSGNRKECTVNCDTKSINQKRKRSPGNDRDSEVIGPVPLTCQTIEQSASEESDDSDMIGPMPFVDSPADIPLPPNPQLSTIPLPPPKKSTTNQSNFNAKSEEKGTIDSENIAAGLRFLREKFEDSKKG